MKNIFFVSGLIVIISLGFISNSFANSKKPKGAYLSVEQTVAAWPKLNGKQKFFAIEQLIKLGKFKIAEDLLNKTKFRSRAGTLKKRFYTAVILKSKGKLKEAAKIYRSLLADNPKFARVRLELAHTLYLMKEDTSAKHHLNLVMSSSGTHGGLQNRVRRFIDAINQRRSWSLSTYVTLAPSTNFNAGTDQKTLADGGELGERSIKKSGLGLQAGVNAGYRHPVTDKLDMVVSLGANTKQYKGEYFDDSLVSLNFGPRYRLDGGYIALYGNVGRRWFGGDEYQEENGYSGNSINWGGRLHGNYRLSNKEILSSDVSCQKTDYDDDGNAWRNAYYCGISASYDRYLSSNSFVRFLAGGFRNKTDEEQFDHNSFNGGYVGLGHYRELPWGITVYVQGKFVYLDYSGVDQASVGAFQTDAFGREDKKYEALLNLTKRNWSYMGYAPTLQYSYVYNDSNIGAYEYDSHTVNLTLTKNF